jgi:hypothetical protein
LLGHERTRGLLALFAGALVLATISLAWLGLAGGLMPGALAIGCLVLLLSLRFRMQPVLLSLLADLLLLVPAIVELMS